MSDDKKFTAEDFESLQVKLQDEKEKSDKLKNTQTELENIFLDGLDDDVTELIPAGLNLTEKILFIRKLDKRDRLQRDLGKTLNNDEINNPGNQQPGGGHGNPDEFKGLNGKDLLYAGLNFKNYK